MPPLGKYVAGNLFLDRDEDVRKDCENRFEEAGKNLGLEVICWRDLPKRPSVLGSTAQQTEPILKQVFMKCISDDTDSVSQHPKQKDEGGKSQERVDSKPDTLNRQAYILRKWITSQFNNDPACPRFYICSLSSSTIVYKGQLNPCQLWEYFDDLIDETFETYICIVHTRFSTNTFPNWERAHPNRYLAHNGEINTLRGNVNLMRAREGVMYNKDYEENLKKLYPVVEHGMTDSGSLDNVLEFLVMAGNRSLPEAIMTMVPEAWQKDDLMADHKKNFYRWASCLMEPWDGPALLTFSDGRYVGAILDRNGLRPSRFYVTKDNVMVMASEVGVFDAEPENVVQKDRLRPGKMLLVDTEKKSIILDDELKRSISLNRPHGDWWNEHVTLEDMRRENTAKINTNRRPLNEGLTDHLSDGESSIIDRLWKGDKRMPIFGYTIETLEMLMVPMLKTKKEALGSMGNDAPLACLSKMHPLVYEYFKQLFAQVTNPPIDPFREKIVMSLACPIGPESNLLMPSGSECRRLWLENPIISLHDLEVLKHTRINNWKSAVLDITYDVNDAFHLSSVIDKICKNAAEEVINGNQFIVLSDRNVSRERIPVSSILAVGAVHHHLIRERLRSNCAIVLETGEAREVHQLCILVGYGCDAICPYMVFEMTQMLREENVIDCSDEEAFKNYVDAVDRGISKVMAKMGISTMQSYKGAQIFEAVGLAAEVINKCFVGTASRVGGIDFKFLADEALNRHRIAFGIKEVDARILHNPGFYHYR